MTQVNHNDVLTHLELDILMCEVKWALGSTTTSKVSGGYRISAELLKILKDDAFKVLHSICQHICKTQQWATGQENVSFFPILWPLLSFPNLRAYGVQHFHSIVF